jgi:riboflavin kinase/FMN adenylyltransferase
MSSADTPVAAGLDGLAAADGRLLVSVGVFDGLHRGHAALVRALVAAARARDARPTIVTFDHHPDEILEGHAPPLLLDPAERFARLVAAGVEEVVVLHFDEALRQTSYVDFVGAIRERARLAGFVMTEGSAFGHERRGTPEALATLGRDVDFDVVVVPPLRVGGRPIQSTTIRSAIAAGELATAAGLLGRAVSATGSRDPKDGLAVVGFPMPVALPPAGTYRVRVGPPIESAPVGGWPGRSRTAHVDADGVVAFAGPTLTEGRLRIAFDHRR